MRQDVAWSGLHLKGMRLASTSETCEHDDGSLVVIDSNDADDSSKEDKNISSLINCLLKHHAWIFTPLRKVH